MVQAMLADMDAADRGGARSCCTGPAPRSTPATRGRRRWAAMCKLVAGDTAMRVTTDAVQVLGGYGYIESSRSSG